MVDQTSQLPETRRGWIPLSLFIVGAFIAYLVSAHHLPFPHRKNAHMSTVPMSTVMDAIRRYGQGHSPSRPDGLNAPAVPYKDPSGSAFDVHVSSLLFQEKFDELENIAATARTERTRHRGGVWVTLDFYEALGNSLKSNATEQEWNEHIALFKKWTATFPESATARIALAVAYYNRAWAARGGGYANTVQASAWDTFFENVGLAKSTLLEATDLKDKDPYWYEAMQEIALSEGWERTQARELLDQAIAFEPTYYHYYREYANFLLPKWHGKEGDAMAFAEETRKSISEPMASMVYFEIATLNACDCNRDDHSLTGMSWPTVKEGYANGVRLYGPVNFKMNRFAYLSYVANDKSSANEIFSQIDDAWDNRVWQTQSSFEKARAWATAH